MFEILKMIMNIENTDEFDINKMITKTYSNLIVKFIIKA